MTDNEIILSYITRVYARRLGFMVNPDSKLGGHWAYTQYPRETIYIEYVFRNIRLTMCVFIGDNNTMYCQVWRTQHSYWHNYTALKTVAEVRLNCPNLDPALEVEKNRIKLSFDAIDGIKDEPDLSGVCFLLEQLSPLPPNPT